MNDNKNDKNNDNKNKNILKILIMSMLGLLLFAFFSRNLLSGQNGSLSYDEFLKILETKEVEEVVFNEMYNRVRA
ncbi:MAG: hypothetical protein J6Y95_05430, partial [Lachnospiraceae bacterium]|nr:hypothetical protein [Lachnospiraceae bacterium]